MNAFWQWWIEGGAAQAAAAIDGGAAQSLAEPLSARVAALHPELAWELAPGQDSSHLLVVSAEGNPELRSLARRWLQAAPPVDAVWSYADVRPAAADVESVSLTVAGVSVDFAEVLVSTTPHGAGMDVAVFHPGFIHLADATQAQLTFLALDMAVGEEAVGLWIKRITPTVLQPLVCLSLSQLREKVTELAAAHVNSDGSPMWSLMQGAGPRGPMMAMAMTPLVAIVAPDLDTHVEVTLTFKHGTTEGYPVSPSLEALRALEDRIGEALRPAGLLVAHESAGLIRTLHFYVAGGSAASIIIDELAHQWDEGAVTVKASLDPSWHNASHLRP